MLALEIYFVCTALLVAEYLKLSCWRNWIIFLDYKLVVMFIHLVLCYTVWLLKPGHLEEVKPIKMYNNGC